MTVICPACGRALGRDTFRTHECDAAVRLPARTGGFYGIGTTTMEQRRRAAAASARTKRLAKRWKTTGPDAG